MSRLRRLVAVGAVLALTTAGLVHGSPAYAAGLSATFSKQDWGSGYEGKFTISNGTPAAVGWTLEFDIPAGSRISSFWNAQVTTTGTHVVAVPPSWAPSLAAGASTSFGFIGAPGGGTVANCTINGGPCDGSVDTTPPTAPTDLTGSVTATGSGAELRWTASTDAGGSGLAGYNIYRDGTGPDDPIAQTDGTATVFVDSGLAPETTYTYVVRARDGAGNVSGPSNQVTVTTPASDDGTPPTAPTNLTSPSKTTATVSLSWGASTDAGGSGLAGYNIYRDGTGPANPTARTDGTGTTFTDTGLADNTTYTYVVRARDGAGNVSGPSNQISVTTNPVGQGGDVKKVAYFAQWGIYGRDFMLQDVDRLAQAGKLTHLNYAFANVNQQSRCFEANQLGQGDAWADYQRRFTAEQSVDGVADTFNQPLAGNFNQILELKAKYPDLKVLMSIGGWTWSKYFSDAALPANRAAFVASCIDMFIKGNLPKIGGEPQGGPGSAFGVFDGFDLDWEWPASEGNVGNVIRPEDKQNFTGLLAEFRRQLDAYGATVGRDYLLTAFLPADPAKISVGFEPEIFNYLDYATVQGYDLYGAWEPQTNHQAQLRNPAANPNPRKFSVEIAVNAWLANGGTPDQLVVGFPAYGRGWTGVASTNNGLYQSGTAAPGRFEAGVDDYKEMAGKPGTVFRDSANGAVWKFGNGQFWSYDDPQLVREKAAWVTSQGLGGMMMWSLDGDDGSLVEAMDAGLR